MDTDLLQNSEVSQPWGKILKTTEKEKTFYEKELPGVPIVTHKQNLKICSHAFPYIRHDRLNMMKSTMYTSEFNPVFM